MRALVRISYLFLLYGTVCCRLAFAQQQSPPVDSATDSLFISTEDGSKNAAGVPKPSLEGSIQKSQEYTIALNRINLVLNNELDTLEILENLTAAERLIKTIDERLEEKSNKVNLRYLNALENLINTIKSQTNILERRVTARTEELIEIREQMDQIKEDDLFRYYLRDSTILPEYQRAISVLRGRISHSDSSLNAQRILTAAYQSRVSNATVRISELSEIIDNETRSLERALFKKENNYIWESKNYPVSGRLNYVLLDSLRLNEVIFFNYLYGHLPMTFFLLGLCMLLYFWINNTLKKIAREKEFAKIILQRARFVPSNPLLCVLLIILPIAPFFYINPPISFVTVILVLMVLVTSVLIKRIYNWRIYWLWIAIFFVFLVYTISNLYWEIAFQERWHLLGLSVIGIYLGVKLLVLLKRKPDLLPDYMGVLARFYICLQAASILANVFGRFSLGKILGVAATISFVQAVGLYVFVLVVMEVIYLQMEVSRKSENDFTSYIDFYGIQDRLKKIFSGLAFLIWAYYLLDNLSVLDLFMDHARSFLMEPRNLMNSTFTFGNITVFILVVYVATVLANNIAYFASIKDQQRADTRSKRLGSSILLIRLGILSIGFLMAVGASGIPLDKITIVLGALSVGIGFGLQTIVNNLVSGVILAFEKPIQIGDAIEVGGRSGMVKEVGIRSSKIQSYDGSEVIIPNGDLLSQHLINWTLSDKKRRVELIIGVSYNSNMELVADLLKKQLDQEIILKKPEPKVYLQNFAESAVEFRVLFWVENFETWVEIRNQVMKGIFKTFRDNKVEIPFPQRDLNFKSFPGVLKENIKSPDQMRDENADIKEDD